MHLKPDIDIATKHIERDYYLTFLLCISVIALAVYAFIQDWGYKPVFVIMSLVAFIFLGNKKDIPNETWTPQQKATWTKRYTTLNIKDGNIVYVSGESPSDRESYELTNISHIEHKDNKLFIIQNDSIARKISTKYWEPAQVQQFLLQANEQLSKNS